MPIRLKFDTRKFKKYVICREIDHWGGQNHVLCYFIRNIGFRLSIFHQSWVQISYNVLVNNLNDPHVNKAWFWHQEVAKIGQMQRNWSLRGQNHVLCYFIRNMWFRGHLFYQSRVQISYDGLENNLYDFHSNKAWIWHLGSCKNMSNAGKFIFEGVKITLYAILSEIRNLDCSHCTNLEYKLVILV